MPQLKKLNNKISFVPVCMKYQSDEDSDQPRSPWMHRLIQIFTGPFFIVVLLFFGKMYYPFFTFNLVSLSWRCK